jgi:hypothetical protein
MRGTAVPDPKSYAKIGAPKALFVVIAEARMKEFKTLKDGGHHLAAVYMAGYAVEALLKAVICKTLDAPGLPRVFYFHDLDVLLFFSGLGTKMQNEKPSMYENFTKFQGLWRDGRLRYDDPSGPAYSPQTCENIEKWLNDPVEGIVVWLKGRT